MIETSIAANTNYEILIEKSGQDYTMTLTNKDNNTTSTGTMNTDGTLTTGPVYIGGEPPAITPVGREKFSGTYLKYFLNLFR